MIEVKRTKKKVKVVSDYNKTWVEKARQLGGKWSGGAWNFDIREEPAVRDACMEIFGCFDEPVKDVVTVILRGDDRSQIWASKTSLSLFGKMIARGFGRDSGAKLGDGVSVRKGRIDTGGSVKNWTVETKGEYEIVIRDVPRVLVEGQIKELNDHGRKPVEVEIQEQENDSAEFVAKSVESALSLVEGLTEHLDGKAKAAAFEAMTKLTEAYTIFSKEG
jgi:hypothetical protein